MPNTAVLPDATPLLIGALADIADVPSGFVVHEGIPDRGELIARVQGHAGVLNGESYFDEEVLDACPELRTIVFLGTGASSYIDMAACDRRGISVRTVSGYGDRTVAEHAIALLFAVYRDVAGQHLLARGGGWGGAPIGELTGKTLGVMGLGGIGQQVAAIGEAIGMRVVGWSRTPRPELNVEQVALEELLATADAVSLHLELNDRTIGFLDKARLGMMRQRAVLINTARGALVDEAELTALLHSGHLAGVGLDVFATEPPLSDDPLRTAPNVTLTCHTGWQSPEAVTRLMATAMRHLKTELARLQ